MCVSHMEVTKEHETDRLLSGPVVHSDQDCMTVRAVLNRIGDKWSILVIALLGDDTKRFTELQRAIEGISQRMLTLTLRQLERDGLVERTVYPMVPPRVDYRLTPLGRTLLEPVMTLATWAYAHRADIEAARHAYDNRHVPPTVSRDPAPSSAAGAGT